MIYGTPLLLSNYGVTKLNYRAPSINYGDPQIEHGVSLVPS